MTFNEDDIAAGYKDCSCGLRFILEAGQDWNEDCWTKCSTCDSWVVDVTKEKGGSMRVIIAGSREGFYLKDVAEAVDQSGFHISQVVSGGARGVDRLGEVWAADRDIEVKVFLADWDRLGKSAGHARNRKMGDYADALIALWNGKSRGTKGMIDYMNLIGKPVHVFVTKEE